MKTIFKNGTYQRVSDEVAEKKVNKEGWNFVPKSEWKEKIRDAEKASKKESTQISADESRAKKELAKEKANKSVKKVRK